MVRKKHKVSKQRYKHREEHFSEKLVVLLFLVFIITSIIIIFRGNSDFSKLLGFSVGNLQLEKTQYNNGNRLEGTVTLSLDPGDRLPANATMIFSILTNASKCATEYVCAPDSSKVVPWYSFNSSIGSCDLSELDTEGQCCIAQGKNCSQVIINKEFDKDFGPYWTTASSSSIGIDTFQWEEGEDTYNKRVMYQDGGIGGSKTFSLRQGITGARKIRISSETQQPAPYPVNCQETDGGKNYEVFGTCTTYYSDGTTSTSSDSCKTNNLLREAYCENKECHDDYHTCIGSTSLCSNGACVSPGGGGTDIEFAGAGIESNGIFINWSVAWQEVKDSDENPLPGCAFEIVLKSNTSRSLHYYYPLNDVDGCRMPSDSSNSPNRYIEMNYLDSSTEDGMSWDRPNRNVTDDWTSKFSNTANDYINETQILSYRKNDSGTIYSQKVLVDYISLSRANVIPETNCTKAGKKCCVAGSGLAKYYGDEFNCSGNDECWSSCADSAKMRLITFISKTPQSSERNRTAVGECWAVVDGVGTSLHDWCNDDGVGKGYTAYFVNGSAVSYTLDLSDSSTTLRAPSQNGTYELRWKFEYMPVIEQACGDPENGDPQPCPIFDESAPFTVGTIGSCTPNWVFIANCSDCVNNLQCITEQDQNNCESPNIRNSTITCGCTIAWGNCSWQRCNQGEIQNNLCYDIACNTGISNVTETRTCCIENWTLGEWGACIDGTRIRTYTDQNSCGTTFAKPQDQSESCGNVVNIFKQWYFWAVIIIILVVIFIILLFTVLKKKPSAVQQYQNTKPIRGKMTAQQQQPSSEYSEVISYINEAITAGISKEEIKAKLLEAGWPEDVIEKCFLDAGI
jgi:cell division protein FtsL